MNGFEVTLLTEKRQVLDDAVNALAAGMMVFGIVVMVAGLVVVAQLVSRMNEEQGDERRVLRDLGLPGRQCLAAAVLPGAAAAAVATCGAVAISVALSPFTPLGVARRVEPTPGVEWNMASIGLGAVSVASLTLVVWALAARATPQRHARRNLRARPGIGARLGALGDRPELPVASALAFGDGRSSAPRRLAFLGVIAGVAGIVASAVFGASLDRLASDPARWGWVGDHAVELPGPVRERAFAALDGAEEVSAYAEVQGGSMLIEGEVVDVYSFRVRRGSMEPTLLAGWAPSGPGEIALGPKLLDDLGIGVGDLVDVDGVDHRVTGSVLTFGISDRSSNTDAAMVGTALAEPEFTTAFVRFADGVDADRAAEDIYGDLEYGPAARPSQVANLSALRGLPLLLGIVLGVVGVAAVAHTAIWIAGRSRGDLAVLRAFGLPRRRAARIVTAASALLVVTAASIGGGLGVVAGRTVWTVVAGSTDLATDVRFPGGLLLIVPLVLGGVLTLGAWCGRHAVRRPAGEVLRAE